MSEKKPHRRIERKRTQPPYEADYGNATPEEVAEALLRYRGKDREPREKT